MVLIIVIYALFKKIDLYEAFIEGSKESFKMIITIFPNLLAMILSVNIIINSGFLNTLISLFTNIKLPIELITLIATIIINIKKNENRRKEKLKRKLK